MSHFDCVLAWTFDQSESSLPRVTHICQTGTLPQPPLSSVAQTQSGRPKNTEEAITKCRSLALAPMSSSASSSPARDAGECYAAPCLIHSLTLSSVGVTSSTTTTDVVSVDSSCSGMTPAEVRQQCVERVARSKAVEGALQDVMLDFADHRAQLDADDLKMLEQLISGLSAAI